MCRDVSVIRSAACWTDHFMVRAPLKSDFVIRSRDSNAGGPGRKFAIHLLRTDGGVLEYRRKLESACCSAVAGSDGLQVEEKWTALRKGIVEASENALGRGSRPQPDWFLQGPGQSIIAPLIEEKNAARQRMLTQNTPHSRSAFRSTQCAAAMAVCDAKTGWIESVAERAERARGDGCERWKCINQLRSIHHGRRSATTSAVFDEEGNLTTSPEAVRVRWHQHFQRVLNIQSEFDLNIIEEVPCHAVRPELDDVTEVIRAVRSLRLGTAGGSSGIVPGRVWRALSSSTPSGSHCRCLAEWPRSS